MDTTTLKKQILTAFFAAYGIAAPAGIYRDDVPVARYRALAAQPQFQCVGELFDDRERMLGGSCILVGNRYVLSAAHCFIKSDSRQDTMTVGGKQIIVNQQMNERVGNISTYSFRFGRRRYHGKAIKIFPAYLDSATKGWGDMALIQLTDTLADINPATLSAAMNELHSVVVGVGYGASGKASMPEDVDVYMEKIAGENTIDSVYGYMVNGRPSLMCADFDHPTNTACNKLGAARALPLEYTPTGGDSGGGLFRRSGSGWQLIGVCVGSGVDMKQFFATGYYGQTMSWTRVSVFRNWILQTMNELDAQ